MLQIFASDSPYKKQARFIALLWTLLIFISCLMPGDEIPEVNVPFVDKWVHLVLFGGFSFLWLCGYPVRKFRWLFILFLLSLSLGSLIELLQGFLTSLHRSMEFWDAVADGVGGLLGIGLFLFLASIGRKKV